MGISTEELSGFLVLKTSILESAQVDYVPNRALRIQMKDMLKLARKKGKR